MKILLVNKFLYPKGGDAIATLNTGELLQSKGHQVLFWGMDHPLNPEYDYKDLFIANVDFNQKATLGQQLKMASRLLYSLEAKRKITSLIQEEKPDIVHLHNFAHQISPSILHTLKKHNIPAVMTMHDYKLVCASYTLSIDNTICESCKNGKYYQCLLKACVKSSRVKSFANMLEMYLHHTILKIYNTVDFFISPSIFLKNKVHEMGFNRTILFLPNFIKTELISPQFNWEEKSIIYFGRLSQEKGIFTLINAVKGLELKLKIIGDGPAKNEIESYLTKQAIGNVQLMGFKKSNDLQEEVKKAMAVVVPSQWYENNPLSIIESFAMGKPVIGANIGGIPELIQDGKTGFIFEPGEATDLAMKIKQLLDNPEKTAVLGKNARAFVEGELNAEKHYSQLIEIYKKAISKKAD